MKFFCAVGSGGNTRFVEREMKEFGVLYEVLRVDHSGAHLKRITAWIRDQAQDNKHLIFSKQR